MIVVELDGHRHGRLRPRRPDAERGEPEQRAAAVGISRVHLVRAGSAARTRAIEVTRTAARRRRRRSNQTTPAHDRDDQQRHQRPRPAERHHTSLPGPYAGQQRAGAQQRERDGDEPAGQRYVLLGHRQPEVDGGGDAVELRSVGGRVVAAAGGLRDGGQPLGIQSRVQLEAVDLDGRAVGRAYADGLDVYAGVLGDRRCGRHRVAAAALVLTVGEQHDGRRAPVPDVRQLAVLADRDRTCR